ncbi:MAG TPA: hemerythrin domain-containing protein, partial [Rhodocyclaceae bacterium]|nr:hemerythrin domain-containing protein [Rhodocyclaceae bacterium]
MATLTSPLIAHHKYCDELYAEAEGAAHDGRWQECGDACGKLCREIEAHFATEEQVLFPAFEAATGMTSGPTQMMRFEHAQMRELLGDLATAEARRDLSQFA